MVVSCCVINCARCFKPKDIPFYCLPKDPCKRQKWLVDINRKSWIPMEDDHWDYKLLVIPQIVLLDMQIETFSSDPSLKTNVNVVCVFMLP
ncbi:hypothetical protein ACJMK2_016395 [Sinanodonta woodiana]|uniref:THAP-type domain-containing protein n=1 Tax=Sinanodonta woodiana TaxID=1069815 RepID=A0ABD3UTG6_SINWO